MTAKRDRKKFPGPDYHVQVTLPAPLPFAFAWCTDFTPRDPELEGEKYHRKIVGRNPRIVVYEDLEEDSGGWSWGRFTVTLQPPDRWHMESTGTHVQFVADYKLTALPGNKTRFEIFWRRQPGLLEFTRRTKSELERSTRVGWKRFAQSLGRDYRKSHARAHR